MPHYLKEAVQAVANLKQTTPEAIRQAMHHNFLRLVQDDPWLPERYVKLLSEQGDWTRFG